MSMPVESLCRWNVWMRTRLYQRAGYLILTLFLTGATWAEPAATNAQWAVSIEKPGLPNFHKVSATLYRGAQPTAEGYRQLQAMGIKTVINLRSFHTDRKLVADTGIKCEHLYVKAWHPEDKELIRFLQVVTDTNRTPVFVHCQHGADRTGMMCAIYRMAVQGWPKELAIKEMTEGDFGFHSVWKNLTEHLRDLDVGGLKKRAGLTK